MSNTAEGPEWTEEDYEQEEFAIQCAEQEEWDELKAINPNAPKPPPFPRVTDPE